MRSTGRAGFRLLPGSLSARRSNIGYAVVLVAILVLAAGLRLYNLLPPDRGALFAADADEGIYATSARLALNGYLPYRDYFCSAPPLALYMFMAVLAPTSPPWGNESSFMALRYTSVVYGLVTLLAAYAIGSRLGGKGAGLLAAGLLAIDGWAVAQDRRAMLEAPMSMFSALAILALIIALRKQQSQRWYMVTGILAGMAILTKTQGAVALVAILLALIVQRRWRPAAIVLGLAGATYCAVSLPYLLAAADDFVRQLFFFQFLRPPNGDPALMLRVNAIRNYPESWLTVRLGLLGGVLLLVRWLWNATNRSSRTPIDATTEPPTGDAARSSHSTAWLPVFLWTLTVAASFAVSKTFYLYYYAQMAAPLALLGGSLLHPWPAGKRTVVQRGRVLGRLIDPRLGVAAVLVVLSLWRLPTQLRATVQDTRSVKSAYVTIGQYLSKNTPAGAPVLTFEPNYTFLASRPPLRLADGTFFVDSHADMLYRNLGIKGAGWADLTRQLVQRKMIGEQALLWQKPAQNAVSEAAGNAPYIVIDPRARYLCTPDTLKLLEAASSEVVSSGDTVLRQQR